MRSCSFGRIGGLLRRGAAGAFLCASLQSCYTTVGKWTYPSGRYPTTECQRPADAVIAVERLVDLRSDTNRSWIAWAYVPLSPGGWKHFDRPEATAPDDYTLEYRMDVCDDLARSIAVELRRTRVAKEADYKPDGLDARHTHVLRGKVRSFYVHESRWTYGVSIYAYVLWGLAAPVGWSDNAFCVDLELVDVRSGRVVWMGSVFDSDSVVEGLYYGPEWYRFSWLWERRLRVALRELATALGTEPAPLPDRLSRELREGPAPAMPACLGVDSASPCTVR